MTYNPQYNNQGALVAMSDRRSTPDSPVFHDDHIARLAKLHLQLEERLAESEARVAELTEGMHRLHERLLALEPQEEKKEEDLNERILDYLRNEMEGRWQPPIAVAANLEVESKRVDGRLLRMYRAGIIERLGPEGRGSSPLYRLLPTPALDYVPDRPQIADED